MRVLQLCIKPPYPPVDGGTMAMNGITQGLLEHGCKVKVLTVESAKHPMRWEQLPEQYKKDTSIEAVAIDLAPHVVPAAVAMLCGESYQVKRYESREFAERIRAALLNEEYDVVHVESIFLTPYVPLIRKHSQARVILRAHNVEHLIWQQVANSSRPGLKRGYLKHMALTLRAYELEHVNDYDGVVCITQADADYFRKAGCKRPVTAIPFGMEAEEVGNVSEEPYSLFHIGAMDWLPNQEGVEWLLSEVWPAVRREVPQARLYLAGRKMPERWKNAQIEGVTIVGEVPDAMYFIGSKQVNIVPLRSGGGIRVKIIEAMSVGKVVVTTSVGARGIEYTDGENLLIADSPEEFARQVKRCFADEALRRRVSEGARRLVAEKYDAKRLSEELIAFYHTFDLPDEEE